jgi:hypothetical protein
MLGLAVTRQRYDDHFSSLYSVAVTAFGVLLRATRTAEEERLARRQNAN